MNEFQDFLVKFLTYFALSLIPIVVPLMVAKAKQWLAEGKASLQAWTPTLAGALEMGAKLAVNAAEQAGAAGLLESKKEYAVDALKGYMRNYGYNVDLHVIDAAIEAAVKEAAFPHS